jgi:sugar lactone lactonase YvrE
MAAIENTGLSWFASGRGEWVTRRKRAEKTDAESLTRIPSVRTNARASSRFNDGKIDPAGGMVLGTIDEKRVGGLANLYRYNDNDLRMLVSDLTASNGTAFSPDGQTLYYADSPKSTVWKCPYDPSTGKIGPSAVFFRTASDEGRPDGAAVDSEGCYWIALFNGGRIRRYHLDGAILEEHYLPARCPTMLVFGGEDLRTLYATTARAVWSDAELAEFPHSGSLFSMQVPVAGLPPICLTNVPRSFWPESSRQPQARFVRHRCR